MADRPAPSGTGHDRATAERRLHGRNVTVRPLGRCCGRWFYTYDGWLRHRRRDMAAERPSGTGHDTARAYPTEFVECDRCDGDGEIEGEDFFCCPRCCWQCGGTGTIEVCASCLDTGEECDRCGR